MNRYWYSAAEAADGGMQPLKKMQILSEKRLFLKTEKSFCDIGPAFTKVKTMQDYFRSGFILNFIISTVFLADMPCPLQLNTLSAPES